MSDTHQLELVTWILYILIGLVFTFTVGGALLLVIGGMIRGPRPPGRAGRHGSRRATRRGGR